MSLLWPPITTPQLGGVIEVTFFEKMIRCRAREKTNIWRPWCQELRKRQRWIGILENWGCFLQNYELLLGQYSKISNQWNFLEKDTNFCWIFYLMPALHKKSRRSLRPSTGHIGWDFFSKIGIKWGTYFSKKVPIFETFWFTPAMHRPLTVKGVYVVSHSWYVQVYELVCIICRFLQNFLDSTKP